MEGQNGTTIWLDQNVRPNKRAEWYDKDIKGIKKL